MKTAEQWVETVDRNPDFDSWRYGRSELAALVRAIQADALRHAAEIAGGPLSEPAPGDVYLHGFNHGRTKAAKHIMLAAESL